MANNGISQLTAAFFLDAPGVASLGGNTSGSTLVDPKPIDCPGHRNVTFQNTGKICGKSSWITITRANSSKAEATARAEAIADASAELAKKAVAKGFKCKECKPHPGRRCTLWAYPPPEPDQTGKSAPVIFYDCVVQRRATAAGVKQVMVTCCFRQNTFQVKLECTCDEPPKGPITQPPGQIDD